MATTTREHSMVLLIDDDPMFAHDVGSALPGGRDMAWLPDSQRALETIREERHEVVLLDLNMPKHLAMLDEEEGIEILERLTLGQRLRVVVVTRSLTEGARERLRDLGVGRIHFKSNSLAALVRMIEETSDSEAH
jgi:DNA-binding NarL/FixJ family response regulator